MHARHHRLARDKVAFVCPARLLATRGCTLHGGSEAQLPGTGCHVGPRARIALKFCELAQTASMPKRTEGICDPSSESAVRRSAGARSGQHRCRNAPQHRVMHQHALICTYEAMQISLRDAVGCQTNRQGACSRSARWAFRACAVIHAH